jgi:acyl carrier protein
MSHAPDIVGAVVRVVAEMVRRPAEELSADTHLFIGLGFTSSNGLELVMRLEEEFGIELLDQLGWSNLETLGALTAYVATQAAGTPVPQPESA